MQIKLQNDKNQYVYNTIYIHILLLNVNGKLRV